MWSATLLMHSDDVSPLLPPSATSTPISRSPWATFNYVLANRRFASIIWCFTQCPESISHHFFFHTQTTKEKKIKFPHIFYRSFADDVLPWEYLKDFPRLCDAILFCSSFPISSLVDLMTFDEEKSPRCHVQIKSRLFFCVAKNTEAVVSRFATLNFHENNSRHITSMAHELRTNLILCSRGKR